MTTTTVKMGKTLKGLGLILALGMVPLAAGLTGCAGDRYTQSTGEMIDDNRTSERVREKLDADTQFKYADVKVQSFKGVVQLSGFVNSKDQKSRAGDLAKNVRGVETLENNITVKETTK